MTLTTILPSLRRSIPDPLDPESWPATTAATTTDVVIAGVSLTRLAEWCGTPCVHTAPAVIPRSGGRPSASEQATVVLASVTGVGVSAGGTLIATIDADLDDVNAVWSELRLIGRVSTAHTSIVAIRGIETERGSITDPAAAPAAAAAAAAPGAAGTAASAAPDAAAEPSSDECWPLHLAGLPGDLRIGDLVAVPCPGAIARRHLHPVVVHDVPPHPIAPLAD
ncbi:hypothetical protein ACL9RL_17535 [Plantibacter sp. Mn2098]|uniref:hypothetical protein n=1 Tax=Plantibacter sp. Mn2098 TaxID=3395266 RepID=UPI003BE8F8D1